jgi:membrane protein DedA with SNARE-associated domain
VLQWLTNLPPAWIYIAIGAGAAVENIIPPVPADTFVLLGAFLAESGRADPLLVFAFTWTFNVASAVLVYLLAHRYGPGFFTTRAGHWLLRPKQIETIGVFYERWGTPAIFVSRFLPAFRALVPVFAGVTHVPLWRVLPPLAIASGVWYGCLVYIGAAASRNWEQIMRFFAQFSTALLAVAAILIVLVAAWWVRSRREHP